jgi:prephenate dehydratase
VSVAFLGPKASYSHQAALKYFKEGTPELLECATFSEVRLVFILHTSQLQLYCVALYLCP